ncbi:hypothetical protein C8A01DRAFT_33537 [Parachaetomium inaequale]|uniref:Uncharacterized protein n=1 Tax=Parachaetomium inaequale TaxID=2588326 RepID=A0AAN6ST99_9PEZI|nr:hypothetical protein C8A01DRAFT_33537 [Parachaetomium inaequale]
MTLRPVYPLIDGRTSKSRGHFAIFIPNAPDDVRVDQPPSSSSPNNNPCTGTGTVIHVVGNPLIGLHHELKRNYNTSDASKSLATPILLGHIPQSLHVDPDPSTHGFFTTDTTPRGSLDAAALQVPCPGKSDVRAPVDGVVNRRCQEWTMEYVQHLVGLGYLDSSAIQLVQDQRDPPTHGVMLCRGGSDGNAG